MRIAVFGLGYVGCVSAACLAQQGHQVFGVDVNPDKVDLINQGRSPIVEKYIGEIIAEAVAEGRLSATTQANEAVIQAEISLVCVGTPSRPNGSLDLHYIQHVAEDIGHILRQHGAYHLVAVRSTMLPGSLEQTVIPALEQASGKKVGADFGVCLNPEFLREGSAVEDYYHPAFTLIGAWDQRGGDLLARLYRDLEAPIHQTDIRTAEMVKYANNAFHALKVSFANEIGLFCKAMQIDSHRVMDIFTQDTRLNISPKYLRPGFAFGGSCLPKDLRALVHRAKSLDLELPVLQSIIPSNNHHIEQACRMIQYSERRKVGLLGLSFKPDTDDLRESPLVRLAEWLLGKGYDLRIYDDNVSLARVVGANKAYIEQVIPHISELLVTDLDELIDHAEVAVIGNNSSKFRRILQHVNDDKLVIDLVRIERDISQLNGYYQGICW